MAYIYYQQLIDRYLNKLSNVGSSSINCKIFIGEITGMFGKNCNISISNSCLNNQSIINSLLLSSLSEILNIMPIDYKNNLLNVLGIQDINDLPSSTFQEQCKSLAIVNNDISILQLNFGTCTSDTPIVLEFINTGSAMASCGLSAILSSFILLDSSTTEVLINNTPFYTFIYLSIALFSVTILLLLFLHFKHKIKLFYTINHKQYKNKPLKDLLLRMDNIIQQKMI
jgi:hypothetical protein